jgi:hypothetical protein
MDAGTGSAVALCQLAEALSALPIPEDGDAVEVEWLASDVLALEFGPPHPGADPLDDEAPLQLGNDPDDDDDRPAQGAAGVDLLAERDELDVEVDQLIQNLEEVLDRPGDPVGSSDQDDVEPAAAGIPQQSIETRPARFRAGDPVRELLDDLISALLGHLAEIEELGFRMLIEGGDPHI